MQTSKIMSTESSLSQNIKKTDKQHILDNPDTYIGSVELIEMRITYLKKIKYAKRHLNSYLDYTNYLMKE